MWPGALCPQSWGRAFQSTAPSRAPLPGTENSTTAIFIILGSAKEVQMDGKTLSVEKCKSPYSKVINSVMISVLRYQIPLDLW